MSPIRVKMIVGNAVLVKGLIYGFLTQPWAVLPNIKDTPVLLRGLKSCSAALYHVIMDIYKDNILIDKENQKNLHVDRKIKFVKPNSVFVPEGIFFSYKKKLILKMREDFSFLLRSFGCLRNFS